jgi:hypothetical protein
MTFSKPEGAILHPTPLLRDGVNCYAGGHVQVDDTPASDVATIQIFERAYHGKSLPGESAMDACRRIGAVVKAQIARDFADREMPPLITVTQYQVGDLYEFWFTVGGTPL